MDLSAFESMIGEHSNFWDDIRTRRDHAAATVNDFVPESSAAADVASAAATGSQAGSSPSADPSSSLARDTSAPAPAPAPRRAEIHIEDDDPSFAQDAEEPLSIDSEEDEYDQDLINTRGEYQRQANPPPVAESDAVDQFRDLECKLGLDGGVDDSASHSQDDTTTAETGGAPSAMPSSSSSAEALETSHSDEGEGATRSTLHGEQEKSGEINEDNARPTSADFDDSSFNLGAMDAELAALGVIVAPDSGIEGAACACILLVAWRMMNRPWPENHAI